MPKFSINDVLVHVGGPEHFQHALGLQAQIVTLSPIAITARVGSPFDSMVFDVMVSADLEGTCGCTTTSESFCDHIAAAALEWILEGSDHGMTRMISMPLSRLS